MKFKLRYDEIQAAQVNPHTAEELLRALECSPDEVTVTWNKNDLSWEGPKMTFELPSGLRLCAHKNDWILRMPSGRFCVLSETQFELLFTQI